LEPVETPLEPPDDVPAVSAERLVDGHVEEHVEDEPRRYPSTIGGAFYLMVLGASMVGLGLVVWSDWRTGIRWIGAALIFGSLVRLVLPNRDAGMLGVRSKLLDALMLSGVGAALFFLAGTIPGPPS
jgi:hypothetical protein